MLGIGVRRGIAVALAALVTETGSIAGQPRLIGEAIISLEPSVVNWRFTSPVPGDSGAVSRVTQRVAPVGIALRSRGFTLDASAAYAEGRVEFADGRFLDLNGFTDIRVRGVAHLAGDNLLLTFGATAPTGRVRLSATEVEALGVIGAPTLGFVAPFLGGGFGASGGLVVAWRVGPWAMGLGSSVEYRTRYTPIDALVAGVSTPTDLEPGLGYHGSFGLDRVIGSGRLSLLFAGDFFGESGLFITAPGNVEARAKYRLGPQYSGAVAIDLGVPGFRTFSIGVSDRYRSSFTGFDGAVAAGSSGNRMETRIEVVTGPTARPGLLVRLDGLFDSGLEVDNTITTAAMTAGGLTVGAVLPIGRLLLQPFVNGRVGRLDTGPFTTKAKAFGGGLLVTIK